ncbi:unnamed protein product, partial [Discosporangium mesarthrocarpum]
HGIIADLWGPVVGRRNDSYLMRSISMKARLREAQVGNPVQYYAYRETAYAVLSHVKKGFNISAAGDTEAQNCGNEKHECVYGKVCHLWGFLQYRRNLKLRQNPTGGLYLVGALLTNIRTCKYSSQGTESYHEIPPSVEAYFKLQDHISEF